MVNYYVVTLMLTLITLVIMICRYEVNRVNFYTLVVMVLGVLANAGYLSIAISQNVSEAILANKIVYLGGCFIPPFVVFLVFVICNYNLTAWIKYGALAFSFSVYMMVLTIGHNDFYYKDEYLYEFMGTKVLGHSYGIGHTFFYVLLYGFILVLIGLLIYTFVKKRTVTHSNLNLLVAVTVINISAFIVGRYLNSAIEVMPVIYVIDGWVFLYTSRRWRIYNIKDNVGNAFEKQDIYGYAFVDCKMKFLGSNNVINGIFPEMANCSVDQYLEKVPGTDIVLTWFKQYAKEGHCECEYMIGDRHYEGHVESIMNGKKCSGYMLEMREDTDKWKFVKLLAEHNEDLENFQKQLENKVSEQTEEISKQSKKIDELYMKTVIALSDTVDAKDRYTSGHSKRVAAYARMIAIRLGKSPEEQNEIYRAGLLHDVGKIRIPEEIINKPGKLTDEEYNIIKVHSITGYHILRGISEETAIAAKYHHERYDGKGYPNGLVGDKIPETARILGVADSYDAMASNRSYRNALPQEVVKNEIIKGKGTQFDPHIADIMLELIEEDKDYMLKENDTQKKKILTVDDEAMNNKIIAHIMKDEPMYEVIPAKSGREALEILDKQHINLVLLDVKMPEMDGFEVLKLIREKHQVPVVFMTSDKTLDISAEYNQYTCDDYITKPFLPLLVKEIIYNMTRDMK